MVLQTSLASFKTNAVSDDENDGCRGGGGEERGGVNRVVRERRWVVRLH